MLPGLLAEHGRGRGRATCDLPPALLRRLGVVPSYYLRYFYAARRGRRRAADGAVPGRGGRGHRGASSWRCTPTRRWTRSRRCWRSAAAPTTPRRPSTSWRPCSRDRGDVQVVNVRNDGALPFLPDDAVIEVPATRRRHRRHPAAGRAGRAAVRGADRAHLRLRGAGARRGAQGRPATGSSTPCWPIR